MTDWKFDSRSSLGSSAGSDTRAPGPRDVMKNMLAGLSYEDQVALVRPPMPLRGVASAVQRIESPSATTEACETPAGADREPAGAWADSKDRAMRSFGDLALDIQHHVESYRELLRENDPPRGWAALLPLGEYVLKAILGRVGEVIVGRIVSSATKTLLAHTFRMAIKDAQSLIRERVSAMLPDGTEELPEDAVKLAFLSEARESLISGVRDVRDRLDTDAGTFDDQRLDIEKLDQIAAANAWADNEVRDLVFGELTKGWLNMLAGTDTLAHENIENATLPGVLRLVVRGRMDGPIEITRATLYGGGPAVRRQLSGTRVGRWVGGDGRRGLNLVIRTDNYQYTASPETRDLMVRLGVIREWELVDAPEPCLYFAFAVLPGGTVRRDTEPQGRRGPSEAGLWFLDNIASPRDLLDQMSRLPLPEVEAV